MNFFLKFGRTYQKCTEHDEQVVSVCYDARCVGHRFICRNERCGLKHSSHRIKNYEDYKQCQTNIQKHVKLRENIQKSLDRYKDSIVGYLSKIFQQLRMDLFSNINNKYCEKRFLEIEKLYKKEADYVPLSYDYKQCIPQKIYVQIESTLLAKQKHINKVINKQEVLIDFNSILKQKIQEFNTNRKEDQIRAILPFKDCELKLKFTASKNNFLSKRMYDLNIRGPIVLYVQSYKNRRFGGYSSIMFPKYEDDYSIQHRNVHSFLFSLDYGQILPIKDGFKKFAIKGGINFGFGQGDLLISDECNKGNISWAQIGRTYKQPHNCKGATNEWLAGSSYFRVVEYQIYEVEVKRQK